MKNSIFVDAKIGLQQFCFLILLQSVKCVKYNYHNYDKSSKSYKNVNSLSFAQTPPPLKNLIMKTLISVLMVDAYLVFLNHNVRWVTQTRHTISIFLNIKLKRYTL